MRKTLLLVLGGFFAVALLLGMYLVSVYNSVVTLSADVDNKFAQVEVVLQRRFDLIPNLVTSTKAVLTQEQKVFSDIADARSRYAGSVSGSQDKVKAANDLESSLSRLLVIVESYPTLKSDKTVSDLMVELAGTENRISVERQRYNDSVTVFNKKIALFPTNLVANLFGFEKKALFESADGADKAPVVNL